MSAKRKPAKPTKKSLITACMTQTLEGDRFPASVFKFCRENNVDEGDFYALFGSMDSLQKEIWIFFFEETKRLLEKDKAYAGYGNRESMLSFYFTFFWLVEIYGKYMLFSFVLY